MGWRGEKGEEKRYTWGLFINDDPSCNKKNKLKKTKILKNNHMTSFPNNPLLDPSHFRHLNFEFKTKNLPSKFWFCFIFLFFFILMFYYDTKTFFCFYICEFAPPWTFTSKKKKPKQKLNFEIKKKLEQSPKKKFKSSYNQPGPKIKLPPNSKKKINTDENFLNHTKMLSDGWRSTDGLETGKFLELHLWFSLI